MPEPKSPALPEIQPDETRVIRRDTLPPPRIFGLGAILVWDRRLARRVPGFATWRRAFPATYAVAGGEELKALAAIPEHLEKLTALAAGFSRRELTIVAVGGGSVGDMAGFVASIMKRGVNLVHIPSTWLAAVDSAHGGKTALNVAGAKNQVGTFHFPSRVYLIKELLFTCPPDLARQGLGEMVKAALLAGGDLFARLRRSSLKGDRLLWRFLLGSVQVKMDIVAEDPEERKGRRQLLNLGHTVGHVLESHYGWSHGYAVVQGLYFALEWSREMVGLGKGDYALCLEILSGAGGVKPAIGLVPRPGAKKFAALLRQDKKAGQGKELTFVFLQGPGVPLRLTVTVKAVVAEARRQGWVGR